MLGVFYSSFLSFSSFLLSVAITRNSHFYARHLYAHHIMPFAALLSHSGPGATVKSSRCLFLCSCARHTGYMRAHTPRRDQLNIAETEIKRVFPFVNVDTAAGLQKLNLHRHRKHSTSSAKRISIYIANEVRGDESGI